MTEGAAPRRSLGDQNGFVLVMTLLLLGLISAGAVAIMIEAKAGATGVAGLAEAARVRAVAQAGAVRAAYSSLVKDDPLEVFAANEAQPAVWMFDGATVSVSATAESDRIDLNEGRLELIEAVFARAGLDETLRAALMDSALDARGRGVKVSSLAALVRPCLRSSAELRKLDNVFTIVTRAKGVAPRSGVDENLKLIPTLTALDLDLIGRVIEIGRSPLDDRRLRHLQPYLSDRSSHYRITARAALGNGAAAERQTTISLAIRWPHIEVTNSTWKRSVAGRFCD